MECEDIHNVKESDRDIKSRTETLRNEDSDLKKELKNKDTHKVKRKEEDIKNKIKTSQDEDSDSTEKSENEDAHEVKRKGKDIKNRIKILQDEDSDSTEESENENAYEVKHKKDIKNRIKISLVENSDSTEESENEDAHEVKRKDKDMKSKIETSQNEDNDLKKELKNKDTHKVKRKDEDIKNGIKTSQDEDSNSTEESENEDAHEVKRKSKDIKNRIKILQDEDSNSMEDSENEDAHEVKRKDKDIENVKTSQVEDNHLMEESENVDEVEYKDENIRNRIKMLQDENNYLKELLKNKDTCKDIRNWIKTSQNENDVKKKYTCKAEFGNKDMEEEYCSDATYLARQMTSSEKLCQSESMQLYNLCVQLRHTVPPQHEIETRAGSHMPTRKEIEKFEEIISIKKGSYSFTEDNIIASNWKAFCKLHNWNVKRTKPFLQLRIGRLIYMRNTTERRKFVQFLADGLPNRTLYSVYHRFRTLYEDNLQRRYKPEEDEMIIDHLEHNPSLDESRKYADLAKVLRRTRHSIWRRYQVLKKKNKKHKDA